MREREDRCLLRDQPSLHCLLDNQRLLVRGVGVEGSGLELEIWDPSAKR